MEDAGTSKKDDIDSQDSNTSIDHGHLARNCSIKITILTLARQSFKRRGHLMVSEHESEVNIAMCRYLEHENSCIVTNISLNYSLLC